MGKISKEKDKKLKRVIKKAITIKMQKHLNSKYLMMYKNKIRSQVLKEEYKWILVITNMYDGLTLKENLRNRAKEILGD